MRKTLLRTVELRFFQDDANGEWGVTHADTLDNSNGDGFNAFWDGQGLFHDVFEHSHEHNDPYFSGEAAMNIGGEVAAMGALWFYYELGFTDRLRQGYYSPDEVTLMSTLGMMEEAISQGYANYGDSLICHVPRQKPVDSSALEWMIDEHFSRVKAAKIDGYSHKEREAGRAYKRSVTRAKLANLYRYGYRMAAKLVRDETYRNADFLRSFKEFWDSFCKQVQAEELANLFRGITFKIFRDENGDMIWQATFNPVPGADLAEYTLTGTCDDSPRVPWMDDFYCLIAEEEE